MALDRLRSDLNKETEKRKQAEERDQERKRRYQEDRINPKGVERDAFEALKTLEQLFWECVKEFSRITGLRVISTNRRFSLFGNTSPITGLNRQLVASFKPPAICSQNKIILKSTKQLEFTGQAGNSYNSMVNFSCGLKEVNGDTSFDDLKNWLESQFTHYAKELVGRKY